MNALSPIHELSNNSKDHNIVMNLNNVIYDIGNVHIIIFYEWGDPTTTPIIPISVYYYSELWSALTI